jgi:hypothetical protein
MSVRELIKKVEVADRKRSRKDSFKLLVKAKILDKDGCYDARFFSENTVKRSRLGKRVS